MIDAGRALGRGVDVVVRRNGTRWLAALPRYPGMQVSARTFPGLDQAVRDAILIAEDLPEEAARALPLRFEYKLP